MSWYLSLALLIRLGPTGEESSSADKTPDDSRVPLVNAMYTHLQYRGIRDLLN